jgi:hypothetical protein
MGPASGGGFSGSSGRGDGFSGSGRPATLPAGDAGRPGAGLSRPDGPERPGRPDGGERPTHPIAPGGGTRPDRPDRPDRPGHPDRPGRPDHPGHPGHGGDDHHHHNDHWDDWDDGYWHGGWYGGWYPGWYGGWGVVEPVIVSGTVVTVSVLGLGTVLSEAAFRSQPCAVNRVEVNGEIFYQCGPNWFRMAYSEGQFTYVVVNPPPGY